MQYRSQQPSGLPTPKASESIFSLVDQLVLLSVKPKILEPETRRVQNSLNEIKKLIQKESSNHPIDVLQAEAKQRRMKKLVSARQRSEGQRKMLETDLGKERRQSESLLQSDLTSYIDERAKGAQKRLIENARKPLATTIASLGLRLANLKEKSKVMDGNLQQVVTQVNMQCSDGQLEIYAQKADVTILSKLSNAPEGKHELLNNAWSDIAELESDAEDLQHRLETTLDGLSSEVLLIEKETERKLGLCKADIKNTNKKLRNANARLGKLEDWAEKLEQALTHGKLAAEVATDLSKLEEGLKAEAPAIFEKVTKNGQDNVSPVGWIHADLMKREGVTELFHEFDRFKAEVMKRSLQTVDDLGDSMVNVQNETIEKTIPREYYEYIQILTMSHGENEPSENNDDEVWADAG
jgi:hypothetical protein